MSFGCGCENSPKFAVVGALLVPLGSKDVHKECQNPHISNSQSQQTVLGLECALAVILARNRLLQW